ncbi:FkbM family methyltransferase [Pedobacter sp. PLR]|uniref:FkbM family methyltransferase n=1 Tax=Pedobacter sp. PLR TaxID=2994465 RepID=UPI002246A4E1|nr:FkbM family methyltransferase [Pedobacter sp. PLR]MCX2452070.1 FkbM family methyltransferase [Pedobacter sp. PLR]
MLSKIKKSISKLKGESPYLKRSYAQSGEDLIIDFIFKEIGINQPSYLDIGAHHPFYLNNTAIFYERGCRGINIEPDPSLFAEFTKSRKQDINLNLGIGNEKGILDFYQMSAPTLNTFSEQEAKNYANEGDFKIEKVIPVTVETVANILRDYNHGKFPDFLTLDAEGIDEIVIHSIDFEQNFPKIICVETISFSSSGTGVKNNQLIAYLEDKGYLLYADTNINSIFVRKDLWIRK